MVCYMLAKDHGNHYKFLYFFITKMLNSSRHFVKAVHIVHIWSLIFRRGLQFEQTVNIMQVIMCLPTCVAAASLHFRAF